MPTTFRLLFSLVLLLVAISAQAQHRPGENAARKKLDEYITQNIKPSSLNAKQKEYFQILKRTNEVILKGKYDTKKVFDINFRPIAEDMSERMEALQKQANDLRDRADILRAQNKQKLAAQCDACADAYDEMLGLSMEALKIFPTGDMSKMNALVKRYALAEGQLLVYGVKKLPPRNWLTPQEYRILCRKIKMSQQR